MENVETVEKYQRKRQSHWDRLHLKTVSTHLTVEEYERLQVACRWYGRKPYELIRAYLLEYTASVYRKMEEPERSNRPRCRRW